MGQLLSGPAPSHKDIRASGGLARAAAISGYVELLRDLGKSPEMILARHGLSVDVLANPESMIPLALAEILMREAAEETGCAHFSLLLGERQDPASLGVLLLMMQECATLGDALQALRSHLHIHNLGADIEIYEENGVAELEYSLWVLDPAEIRHGAILALTLGAKIVRSLCGPDWTPIEVHFACAKPDDTRPYLRYFGTPVYFGQSRSSLFFNARWLNQPLGTAKAHYRQIVSEFLEQRSQLTAPDWSNQVRRLIRTLLPFGNANIAHVAQVYGISRRTLHRNLAEIGVTFESLLNDVRFELVEQLMQRPDMSLSEIAGMAGYSDLSAFSRACKRHYGMAPRDKRAELLGEG
ncbi:AraC family transcriptional regulator [Pseudokordiimonas caeni]|uniref:AraC family transcriptional regulator n=1 Tax=Pseudokordiimonas caeni TaxID=2997908 RepID=UPI0028127F78|nr:AraC family transcriptional regulator [Pseudokordiimonas caeni]